MANRQCMIFSQDNTFHLVWLDKKNVEGPPDEVRAFVVVRNECTRLPFLISYYRNLGVERFFVVDDHSDDGTREYALQQADIHVFSPSSTYKESDFGNDWLNLLLDTFGTEHWTLVVDADELLIYPHSEIVKLPEFCWYLDQDACTALFVFLLDMYPDEDLSKAVCVPNKPFYEICPFFDSDYVFRRQRQSLSNGTECMLSEEVIGGPRLRKFYPWQRRTDLLSKLAIKLVNNIARKAAFWRGDKPHYAPALFKVPLIKWHKGCKRLSGHIVAKTSQGKIAEVTGVFLHFKFFADFHKKALSEALRKQHYGGGQEYRRYLSVIKKQPNISFMYAGSRRYIDSDSVLKAGLMRTTPAFEELVQSINLSSGTYCRAARMVAATSSGVSTWSEATSITPTMTSLPVNKAISEGGT
jgi:glycosyltransferase involved in cell wall biosynthesis